MERKIEFNVTGKERGVLAKAMRRLAEENTDSFSVFSGNRYLIIRPKFEKFLSDSSEV